MERLKFAFVFAAIAAFAVSCGQSGSVTNTAGNAAANNTQSPNVAPSATVDQASLAKDLYAKNCMICHKDTGKGGKVTIEGETIDPDDITTAKMKDKSDEQLYKYISDGFPDDGMPAFKDKLSAEQIKAIVAHVRVLQGP